MTIYFVIIRIGWRKYNNNKLMLRDMLNLYAFTSKQFLRNTNFIE